eukprot:symbB.v1.2.035739.t3/scaffold4885.1/size33457/1
MQQNKSQEDQLRHLRQQLEEQERAMKQLQSSMGSSEEKKMEALTQRTKELSEAKAQLAELTLQLAKLKEELNGSQQQLKEAEEKRLAAEQRAEAEAAKAKMIEEEELLTDSTEFELEEEHPGRFRRVPWMLSVKCSIFFVIVVAAIEHWFNQCSRCQFLMPFLSVNPNEI